MTQPLTPSIIKEDDRVEMQPIVPEQVQGSANNPYEQALQDKQLHANTSENLLVNEYAGLSFSPGLQLKKPEGSIWSAAWHDSNTLGVSIDIMQDNIASRNADPNYDPIKDIPDEFLNVNDIGPLLGAVNAKDMEYRVGKLKREKNNQALVAEHPWQYMGASALLGLVDPLFYAFPGSRIYTETKAAWQAASTATKAKILAQNYIKMAPEMAALGASQAAIIEGLKHTTQELLTPEESLMSVLSTGLFIGAFGPVLPTGASYYKMTRDLGEELLGNPIRPPYQPKSKNFHQPGFELLKGKTPGELYEATDIKPGYVPGMYKWIRDVISFSPATKMLNSESLTTNLLASDFYTFPFRISDEMIAKKAGRVSLDQLIGDYKDVASIGLRKVDKLFREQLGVTKGPLQGLRTRAAEVGAKGLNREAFSIAVADNLDIGKVSDISQVNSAAKIIRDEIINPTKQRMVDAGIMDKHFLDPEFDNYFTRMWIKDNIRKDSIGFKAVTQAWFNETNAWYRQNFAEVERLNKPIARLEKNLGIASRNLKRRLESKEYKAFQEMKGVGLALLKEERTKIKNDIKELKFNKRETEKQLRNLKKLEETDDKVIKEAEKSIKKIAKKIAGLEKTLKEKQAIRKEANSVRDERVKELEQKIEQYKNELDTSKEALYSFIPKIYLTPDRHIPSIKTSQELDEAAQQTMMTLLGMDVDNMMNPMYASIGGTSGGNPNPLLSRVFTIPSGYKTQVMNPDGTMRTVSMDDFRSKDIWRMVDNYTKSTATPVVMTEFAKQRGLADIAELKRWYLLGIEKDYQELKAGKENKEIEKLTKKQERDYRNANFAFDQMYSGNGRTLSIMGTGMAKFVRTANTFNNLTLLNSASLAAIPDTGVSLVRQGFIGSFQDWLPTFGKKMLSVGLLKGTQAFEDNLALIKDLNYACHTEIGLRLKAFYEESDPIINRTWWKTIAEPLTSMQGNISFMNQIADFSEALAGHLSISRTIRVLKNKFEKGKYSERDMKRNRDVYITEADERHIYEMWKETKNKSYLSSYASNFDQWNINTPERIQAAQAFRASIIKDLTKSTLKPSKADMGRVVDSDIGSLIFKFRDWMFAANNNILYSGLQKIGNREYDVILSLGVMSTLGGMSYILNSLAKDPTGENLDLSPGKLARESLDRAGIFGFLAEPINVFQKWGWFPGQGITRYKDVGMVGVLLGPTIGRGVDLGFKVGDTLQAIYGNKDYTTQDARTFLRLIPYQNLFYLRYLNEQVFNQMAMGLGASEA